MAHMISMAQDWTYDLFMQDAELYKATPRKGVYCRSNASDREQFMTWFKGVARDFKATWDITHDGHAYDRWSGYMGDAFIDEHICTLGFSDYYKDTYGQRPHLPWWFYLQAVEFPSEEDTARTFCADPVRDRIEDAKENRESF